MSKTFNSLLIEIFWLWMEFVAKVYVVGRMMGFTFNSLLIEIFWLDDKTKEEVASEIFDLFQFSFNWDILIGSRNIPISTEDPDAHIHFQFSFNWDILIDIFNRKEDALKFIEDFQFSFNWDILIGFGVLFLSSSFSFMEVFYFNFSSYFKTWSGRVFKLFISDRI